MAGSPSCVRMGGSLNFRPSTTALTTASRTHVSPRRLTPLPSPREMHQLEYYKLKEQLRAHTPLGTQVHPLGTACKLNWPSRLSGHSGVGAKDLLSPRLHIHDGPRRAPPVMTRQQIERELAGIKEEQARLEKDSLQAKERAARNPVSDEMFRFWLGVITGKLRDRFKQMRRGFRALDEDKSGKLSRKEFHRMLRYFNLEHVPDGVFDRLLEYTDKDHSGSVDFDEFARMSDTSYSSEVDQHIKDSKPVWRSQAEESWQQLSKGAEYAHK